MNCLEPGKMGGPKMSGVPYSLLVPSTYRQKGKGYCITFCISVFIGNLQVCNAMEKSILTNTVNDSSTSNLSVVN